METKCCIIISVNGNILYVVRNTIRYISMPVIWGWRKLSNIDTNSILGKNVAKGSSQTVWQSQGRYSRVGGGTELNPESTQRRPNDSETAG